MSFTFAYPTIIFLITLPLSVFMFVLLRRRGNAFKGFDNEVLFHVENTQKKGFKRRTKFIFLFLALFWMTLALARPILIDGDSHQELFYYPLILSIKFLFLGFFTFPINR